MSSLTEFARHRHELKRQLLRRIGYTGGMFGLARFAQIISEVEPLLPAPENALHKEVARVIRVKEKSKYARDMLDVLRALRLIEQAGPRIALSTTGRALHALSRLESEEATRALFLTTLVDVDGDYTLNLFHMLRESPDAPDHALFERILQLIELRRAELESAVKDTFVLNVACGWLDAMRRSTEKTLGHAEPQEPTFRQRIEAAQRERRPGAPLKRRASRPPGEPRDTVRHTVVPRRGWLEQLRLVEPDQHSRRIVTEPGSRLWAGLEQLGFLTNDAVRVPYDEDLLSALSLQGLPSIAKDSLFELASLTYGGRSDAALLSVDDFIEHGRKIHQWTKLRNFNQSHGESIYLAMASVLSVDGQLMTRQRFRQLIESATTQYPARIYRLSQRRAGMGYLVFK